jgi:FKBP-type peptidyl-prolyl cis-trans isomerase
MKKLLTKFHYAGISFFLILIFSCQRSEEVWKENSDFGFVYKVLKTALSDTKNKIEEGDKISFVYQISLGNGKIIQKFDQKSDVTLSIPGKMYRNQFEEAFLYAACGDSLIVKYKFKKIQNQIQKYVDAIDSKETDVIFTYKITQLVKASRIKELKDSVFAEKLHFPSLQDYLEEQKRAIEADSTLIQALKEKISEKKASRLKLKNHNGLSLEIIQEGKGKKIENGDLVCVYYIAALENEVRIFDNNFKSGSRNCFKLDKDSKSTNILEAYVKDLQKGTKAYIFVPAEAAYGKKGSPPVIPPDADLVFYIEVAAIISEK